MTTYAEQSNIKRCKPTSRGGCSNTFPLSEFPGYYRTSEAGLKIYVPGSLCRTCYNSRNRENEKRQQARKKANTHAEDSRIMGMLYFSCVPAPVYSMQLRAERLGM